MPPSTGTAYSSKFGGKATLAGRGEEDALAVGRPAGGEVVVGVEGQAARRAALDGHDEDVVAAVAVGAEGDPAAVRAEDGAEVVGGVGRHLAGRAAHGLHHPDVAEVAEGDEFAVGGDVGRAGHADRILGAGGGSEQGEGQDRKDGSEGARHEVRFLSKLGRRAGAGAAGRKEDEPASRFPRPLYLILPDYRDFRPFAKGRRGEAGETGGRAGVFRAPGRFGKIAPHGKITQAGKPIHPKEENAEQRRRNVAGRRRWIMKPC